MNFLELQTQFSSLHKLPEHPIAYFCAEFALSDELPIYSGGLGVLAGDVIREASATGLPFVGIGLFYKEGYFRQVITDAGMQDELPAYHNLAKLPITHVNDANGNELHIKLFIGNRIILVRVWQYLEGSIPVYLLDTDLEENQELDRRLTLTLYPTDNEWRIQQEIVLGIGGVKLLHKLGIDPSVYHLNEGHSAFAIFEIAHQYMKRTANTFADSLAHACAQTVFTNHTLIPSGNDVFSVEVVRRLLGGYADHLGLPIDRILAMGVMPNQTGYFSMTHLALSASKQVSAVSQSHADFAKITWPDSTLTPITNGVHVPYWQTPTWQKISEQLLRGFEVTPAEMWYAHMQGKAELLQEVLRITGLQLRTDILTLVWARRIAAYKQPLLLFSDIERLKNILMHASHPVQLILAGKAHPADSAAKGMISELLTIVKEHHLESRVVFVPNYNLALAHVLVAGSDIWLNTPIKGQEACGTSGMKAGLNGALQCAISDGWTDEIMLNEMGFSINPIDSATSLYNIIEQVIAPLYYDNRNSEGLPAEWITRMSLTVTTVARRFSSERMVREYIEKLYMSVLS